MRRIGAGVGLGIWTSRSGVYVFSFSQPLNRLKLFEVRVV